MKGLLWRRATLPYSLSCTEAASSLVSTPRRGDTSSARSPPSQISRAGHRSALFPRAAPQSAASGRGGAVRARGWPSSSGTRAEGGAVPGEPGALRGGGRGRGGRPPTSAPAGGDKGSGSLSLQRRRSPGNRPRPLCPGAAPGRLAGVEPRSLWATARPAARCVPKSALAPAPVPMRVVALPAVWPAAGRVPASAPQRCPGAP